MPVQPTYPGVYIEELPSGARTITGVSTSVTAFVGRTKRGSVEAPIRCLSVADFERKCGGLWADSELGHSVRHFFANGGSEALIARVTNGATISTASVAATGGGTPLGLAAASPGGWATSLRVSISHGVAGEVDEAAPGEFHLILEELATSPQTGMANREIFQNVSLDDSHPRYVQRLLAAESNLARITSVPLTRPIVTNQAAFGNASDGSVGNDAAYQAALDRLELADGFNMLVIPPPARGADVSLSVWSAAMASCQAHRAILLVDPPNAWANYEAAASLAGGYVSLRSANAAFFFPRMIASDPLQEGRARPFAPSGAIAGTYARTDTSRGVWKAPAGIDATLAGAQGLTTTLSQAESGLMNSQGVNALMMIASVGPAIWGARTGRGADSLASEWKYVPVRRLALHIEETLARGTRWAVFEPNDERLWASLRQSIGTFMQQLFRQGAFQGASASEAYFVACDANTTTQTDMLRGIVNIVVGFAPLKPAEFVVLQFQQQAGQ
ncbi:phage tail sheath C-terminal domain-containing protein [Nannocystaceae bacterium ST9]